MDFTAVLIQKFHHFNLKLQLLVQDLDDSFFEPFSTFLTRPYYADIQHLFIDRFIVQRRTGI